MQKIKRCNQVAAIWRNATKKEPLFYKPLELGWQLVEGNFIPLWYDGISSLASITEIEKKELRTQPSTESESNTSSDNEYISASDSDSDE